MLTTVPLKSVAALATPVTEIMNDGVVALPATATLADAARTMHARGVHALLVQDGDGRRLGWVTSRGILHNHAREWTLATSVADAITERAAAVAPGAPLAEALDVFLGSGASHVLVADSDLGAPLGVIAESDLVAFLARG